MKKEKTIKTHQRRLKNGKVITVHEHKASYDAAEALREAAKKKGAGGELEALKKKKPVAQKEEEKSPYDEYGFTKDEFKEWYEGTGSKADKKVEKALRKALGRKAYTELNDKAADSYKKGGADKFFNTSLKKMDSATSKDTKFSKEKSVKERIMKSPTDSFKEGEKVSYRDWRNRTTRGKAVGKSFTFSDEDGKYTGQFVTSSDGEYSLVLREDGKKGTFEYLSVGDLPRAAKKAMKANGLKEGEWSPGGRVYFEKAEEPKGSATKKSIETPKTPKAKEQKGSEKSAPLRRTTPPDWGNTKDNAKQALAMGKISKETYEGLTGKKAPKGKTPDGYMGLSKGDLKKRIAEVAKSFGDKVSSEDFKVTGENHRFSYKLPHGAGGGFKTEREALTELLKAAKKLQKNNPNLETRRPGGWMSQPSPGEGAIRVKSRK